LIFFTHSNNNVDIISLIKGISSDETVKDSPKKSHVDPPGNKGREGRRGRKREERRGSQRKLEEARGS
jgi:hypothetical protein